MVAAVRGISSTNSGAVRQWPRASTTFSSVRWSPDTRERVDGHRFSGPSDRGEQKFLLWFWAAETDPIPLCH